MPDFSLKTELASVVLMIEANRPLFAGGAMSFLFVTILVVPVPEPSSMVLLAFGLIGIGVVAFRRK